MLYLPIKKLYDNGLIKCTSIVSDDGEENIETTWEYDESGNLTHTINKFGSEYTAEYNEYGYVIRDDDFCSNPLRDAGQYDYITEYEYIYY